VTGIRDVDWAEVERRGRRLNWLALLAVPAFFAAIVLLTGKYAFWEGRSAWLAIGVFVLYAVVMQVVSVAVPRFRARTAQAYRVQYALRHHVDPGPDLREKADRYAQRMASMGGMVWLFPIAPLSFVLNGQWDRPQLAVPAVLVLVAGVVALVLWWRRQTDASRRWVQAPPGPERAMAPLKAWERWLTARRFVLLMVGLVVVTALVTAGLVLLLD
jgi:hypothetical protein